MAPDAIVQGRRTIERDEQTAAAARRKLCCPFWQEQAIGGDRRTQAQRRGIGQCVTERPPGKRLGECEAQACLRTEGRHIIGDALEQLPRHGPRLGTHQICAEIGLGIASANVTHDTTQVAEIIDPEDDVSGPRSRREAHFRNWLAECEHDGQLSSGDRVCFFRLKLEA